METYYVHPVVDNHIWVTAKGRKNRTYIAFQVDLPGKWFDNTYNCHVDGCDYEFNTLEESLEWGAAILGGEYQFVHTEELYDIFA